MSEPDNDSPKASGLYAELRRRNVFRVAAAYLVIGWLTLQVADVLLGFTGAPEWVGKSLIALLLLGFVPAMALAWVFEVGPEGIRRDDGSTARDAGPQARRLDTITLVAVFFVVVLTVWQHLAPALREAAEPVPPTVSESTPATARERLEPPPFEVPEGSVAVLPFTNRSAEPDSAYFVDGIHDYLLTELARNGALRVISRTSMMEYRDTTKSLRQIGEELAVATILEGAVQRAGERVRINAQLIDARNDRHLWAETFDRQLTPENIFDIQSEIAAAIASALGRTLGAGMDAPAPLLAPTANPQAFDLFLRARSVTSTESESAIRRVIALYRQALDEDPEFALAMGELGLELTNLYWFFTRRDADRDEGRRWVDRALAMQPEQPRLRWILARHLYHGQLDYEGALAQLALAEQGMPGSAEVYSLRSWITRRAGRIEDSLAAGNSAALLDPRSWEILGSLCETHAWLGDLEAAESWAERLASIPGVPANWALCSATARLDVLGDLEAFALGLARHPVSTGSALAREILLLPYWQRDYTAAARAIADYPLDPLEEQFYLLPKQLLLARVARASADTDASQAHAAAALGQLDAVLADHPGDYRAMMARAQALALLGRYEEARDWADRALAQPVPRRDPLLVRSLRLDRLLVLAMIADSEELAGEIDDYLTLPLRVIHFDGLMLDPAFDPHREHPAIRALAAKHSRRASGA